MKRIILTASILIALAAVFVVVFVLLGNNGVGAGTEAGFQQPPQQAGNDNEEQDIAPTSNDEPRPETIASAFPEARNDEGDEGEEDNNNEAGENNIESDPATTAWTCAENVNLRAEPNTSSEVLAVLRYGQELAVIGETGEWKQVTVNNREGYVFAEYVSVEQVERAANPALPPLIPVYNQANGSYTVAIDAGHQQRGNNELEPIGPGASEKKAKVAGGTRGVETKVPEYQLTLDVSLRLRDELVARGYNVFMVRETNEVNISNSERALMATEAGADILVRLHADGAENSSTSGILTLCPTSKNPYISHLYTDSRALADSILTATVEATGAHRRGVSEVDNMTGINWATMPVTIIEMGFMTNPTEDRLMQTAEYQQLLASGIAQGIEKYFAR
ncbi:MAG: N-acetylmuramoyl-L-alanine amidase [Lachnospiraceae bacterium]|jgi:N-acetylmuramoyl-L-alanine amidase|nr:N-acetylmuramoyl-L-alanine amidase [Lachnospiraceae bacterium]